MLSFYFSLLQMILCIDLVQFLELFFVTLIGLVRPFFFFFIYLGFLSQPFMNHRTAGKGGGNSSLPLPPAFHRHLDISQAITADSSLLHIGSSRIRTRNVWFLSASPLHTVCVRILFASVQGFWCIISISIIIPFFFQLFQSCRLPSFRSTSLSTASTFYYAATFNS